MTVGPQLVTTLASDTRPSRRRWAMTSTEPDPSSYTQGSLALTYPLPNGLESDPPGMELTLVPSSESVSIPSAEAWAAKFLQAVVEAVSCDRPVTQLARWTSRSVYAEVIQRRKQVSAQRDPRSVRVVRHQVATVRVCNVTEEIAEVSGRVVTGRRSRALAARLEYVESRWVCTAFVFG